METLTVNAQLLRTIDELTAEVKDLKERLRVQMKENERLRNEYGRE